MAIDILAWLTIAGALATLTLLVHYLPRNREWMLAIVPFMVTPPVALAIGVLEGTLRIVHHH